MNKKKYMGLAVISAMMMLSVTAWAANEGPLTISADTLSYDGNTGRAEASGYHLHYVQIVLTWTYYHQSWKRHLLGMLHEF